MRARLWNRSRLGHYCAHYCGLVAGTALALGALVLSPARAGAVPLDASTHYLLDQTPYHIGDTPDPGGAGNVDPSDDVPAGMVQDMAGNGFIRLVQNTDFTVTIDGMVPDPTTGASPATPLGVDMTYNIQWNGTINGLDPASYFSSNEIFCEGFETCDLMRNESGDVRILFVIYSVRWDRDVTAGTPFGQLPIPEAGFLADSFMTADGSYSEITDPMLVTHAATSNDLVGNPLLGSNPPFFQVDHGVGVKFHLPDDDGTAMTSFDVVWDLGFDINGSTDPLYDRGRNSALRQQIAAYVYTVPEPSVALLLAGGLASLVLAARRRR